MLEFAKEKACLHYPISYWLIMKYKYANQIFLHLISSFIWFCSIYKQCDTENNFGSYRQLTFVLFFS